MIKKTVQSQNCLNLKRKSTFISDKIKQNYITYHYLYFLIKLIAKYAHFRT